MKTLAQQITAASAAQQDTPDDGDEWLIEATELCARRLYNLSLSQVLDEADVQSGVTGGHGMTPSQIAWTPMQVAGIAPRSISQAFQDAVDRLATAQAFGEYWKEYHRS